MARWWPGATTRTARPRSPSALNNSTATAISAGYTHNLALKGNGTVVAWGNNSDGQATVPLGLSNVMAIAAGGYHNLALQSNGMVVAWGADADGQANVPLGLSNVVSVAAGGSHSLAIAMASVILSAPLPAIALASGAGTNLSVLVWQGAPFTCQWSLNGIPLPGATATNLVITNFNLAKAGAYTVSITNRYGYGIATSAVRLTNSPIVLMD